jgi:hypothetical protein
MGNAGGMPDLASSATIAGYGTKYFTAEIAEDAENSAKKLTKSNPEY